MKIPATNQYVWVNSIEAPYMMQIAPKQSGAIFINDRKVWWQKPERGQSSSFLLISKASEQK